MRGLFCKKEEENKYTFLPFQNIHIQKGEPESNKVSYLPAKVDGEVGDFFQVGTFYSSLYLEAE